MGYQAAALLQATMCLPTTECDKLRQSLEKAMSLAERLTTDPPRIEVLKAAQRELERRCHDRI